MKVLQHGKQRTYKAVCFNCGAVLEYMDEDVRINLSNKKYVGCPECETPIWEVDTIEEPDEKILTIDNIQFPEDFDKFSSESGALEITDEKTNEDIKLSLLRLKADRRDWGAFQLLGCGDTLVFAVKHEEEYVVYICKDYYEASIPR